MKNDAFQNYTINHEVIRIVGKEELAKSLDHWAKYPDIEVLQILPIAVNHYDVILILRKFK